MEEEKRHFWGQLNLSPNTSPKAVDDAYANNPSVELRRAWKVLRDPFYASAYSHYGNYDKIQEAGFFDDGLDLESSITQRFDACFLTTPLHKIISNGVRMDKGQGRLAALITTGAFFPLHRGHLEMMQIAKETLEQKGFIVLGGYISPSHDDYLIKKYDSVNPKDLKERLAACQKALQDHPWLDVDLWEGLYNPTYINFTEVVFRLETYLKKHLDFLGPIQVFYVFGSDNIGFSQAFIKKGACVCVPRAGFENEVEFLSKRPEIEAKSSIIFAPQRTYPTISSSQIRHQNKSKKHRKKTQEKGLYVLRDDSNWCIQPWLAHRDKKRLLEAKTIFLKQLEQLIDQKLTTLKGVKRHTLPLEKQFKVFKQLDLEKYINLDACTTSKNSLQLGRLFNLSSSQIKAERIVARPGHPPLKEQIQSIPEGKYHLIDDDIASGKTIEFVTQLLTPKISLLSTTGLLDKTLAHLFFEGEAVQVFDVVDFRDFLFGSKASGLIVRLPNREIIGRAPYTLPYVSLHHRAKIPQEKERSLSIELWKLNLNFFEKITPPILLKESDIGFQRLMKYIGFNENSKMEDICAWHLEQFNF